VVVALLIPVVGRVMPYVQTRLVIALGLLILGLALAYAHTLSPQIDFFTLAKMRMAQTAGLAFLFVPISTLAYYSLPPEKNADAAALYTMFRNLAGGIGISIATALVTSRTQVRQAHLVDSLSPFDQAFNNHLADITRALVASGVAPSTLQQTALGRVQETLLAQSAVLAYIDVFALCAMLAFAAIPFAFLFSPAKAAGGGPGAH